MDGRALRKTAEPNFGSVGTALWSGKERDSEVGEKNKGMTKFPIPHSFKRCSTKHNQKGKMRTSQADSLPSSFQQLVRRKKPSLVWGKGRKGNSIYPQAYWVG